MSKDSKDSKNPKGQSQEAEEERCLPDPDFFTTADLASLMRCSEKTVRRRIAAGHIPARIEGGRLLIDPRDYYDYIRRLKRRVQTVRNQRLAKRARKGRPTRLRKRITSPQ